MSRRVEVTTRTSNSPANVAVFDISEPPKTISPIVPPMQRVEVPTSRPFLVYVILGFNILVFLLDLLSTWLASTESRDASPH
jgi:hypothetical protein